MKRFGAEETDRVYRLEWVGVSIREQGKENIVLVSCSSLQQVNNRLVSAETLTAAPVYNGQHTLQVHLCGTVKTLIHTRCYSIIICQKV
jgi:hypothetical protein